MCNGEGLGRPLSVSNDGCGRMHMLWLHYPLALECAQVEESCSSSLINTANRKVNDTVAPSQNFNLTFIFIKLIYIILIFKN